jgi:hypothetical protein
MDGFVSGSVPLTNGSEPGRPKPYDPNFMSDHFMYVKPNTFVGFLDIPSRYSTAVEAAHVFFEAVLHLKIHPFCFRYEINLMDELTLKGITQFYAFVQVP